LLLRHRTDDKGNYPMTQQENRTGHRARLRQRFLADSATLSETETLELLLTYAIPRRDLAPLAQALVDRFGSADRVLTAPYDELIAVPGIGEQTAILVKVVAQLVSQARDQAEPVPEAAQQPALFEVEPVLGPLFDSKLKPEEPPMRTFANDEIANSLTFIPQAAQFQTLEAFRAYLKERLPYNSESTRERRADYILNRFLPENRLDVPLTYYAAHCASQQDLKPVLFYHVLKVEPIAARVAEEFIWPALPIGRIDREDMREFVLRYLPDIGPASQTKVLRSLFNTYDLLSTGISDGTTLRFHVHTGTLKGFLYVLTAEFPEPGIYTFDTLEQGPMRLWLLWDREWMRRQLYNLRDLGVIAKVSEIDTVRQFTLAFDQWGALRHYFEHPQRDTLAMREQPPT
jgi:hypothetical protein